MSIALAPAPAPDHVITPERIHPNRSPRKATGRPMKYKKLLIALDNDTAYSPATIFQNAEACHLKGIYDIEEYNALRVKVRHTLARLAKNHGFPPEGDQLIHIPGQAVTPAWLGSRWKEAARIPLDAVLSEDDIMCVVDDEDDDSSAGERRFIEGFPD